MTIPDAGERKELEGKDRKFFEDFGLSPLFPVRYEVLFLRRERFRKREVGPPGVWQTPLQAPFPRRYLPHPDPTFYDLEHRLDLPIERLEKFGFKVNDNLEVTVPVPGKGRNPRLFTFAAAMAFEAMQAEHYTDSAGDPATVEDMVAIALGGLFGPVEVGRNTPLRSALQRHLDNPGDYTWPALRSLIGAEPK